MNNSIKKEYFKWIETLYDSSLIETDKKIVKIITDNLDELEPLGTNNGLRAKKIVELIQLYKDTVVTDLPKFNLESDSIEENIEKISEFVVGPFRGFSSKETINTNNNFVFLYGPNGSGKSSFCEGLEYALLGNIWESDAKRIDLEKYIINSVTKKAELPIAYCETTDGTKKIIKKNHEKYQFAFLEKNRIDGFARITAFSPKDQKDRIAILFGLDAFSDFVDGFTDDFKKYLPLSTPIKDDFVLKSQSYEQKKIRLLEIEKELDENSNNMTSLIKEINNKSVIDKETLKLFLTGSDKDQGIVSKLQAQKALKIPDDIKTEIIDKHILSINTLNKSITELENDMKDFFLLSSDIKYMELYNAISAIEEDNVADKDVCPACKTPVSRTTINPFINAKKELQKLKKLSDIKERIPIKAREVSQQTRELKQSMNQIAEILLKIENTANFTNITEVDFINIESIPIWLNTLSDEIKIVDKENSQYETLKQNIEKHNANLLIQRAQQLNVDNEIKKYDSYNEKLIQIATIENRLMTEKQNSGEAIMQFENANKEILEQIEDEQKNIEMNEKCLEAYNKVIGLLKKYRNSLPASYSAGLADKAKEYYNVINSHDSEFEKITELELPANENKKIMVQFSDSMEKYDALYILSEGHIKILGLSILLAKVVTENLKIIILDDIVNAIDDEHKSGVVDLLLEHTDIANRQLILTCHGENFIQNLESRLGSSTTSKAVIRYRFAPMDSSPTRTIKICGDDTKHYLLQAKKAYEKDARKEAASKCRQAVESISQLLWKRLGNKFNINLTVKMRSPTSVPELHSVVTSLIKETKDKRPDLSDLLTKLVEDSSWSILNKGTHVEEEQPEFERADIEKLIKLITDIEDIVISLKLPTEIELEENKEEITMKAGHLHA
jgi:recombinational DNA repair ATPase RecF